MEKIRTSLVVLAAGIGSRFGGGIKQLEPVGPNGEIIMEYSIYDAIAAGFDKVVFITRKELEAEFKKIIKPSVAEQELRPCTTRSRSSSPADSRCSGRR